MRWLCKIGIHRYGWSTHEHLSYCKRGCGEFRNNCYAMHQ